MAFYYIRTGMLGSKGDVFKAKDMDTAALAAAKKWPGAERLHVYPITEDVHVYAIDKDYLVTGVRSVD